MKRTKLYKKVFLGCFSIIALILASTSFAAQVTIAWDPVANVDGYKVYYGTSSHEYKNAIDVGNTTTYTFTLSNTDLGNVYYLAVTSYVTGGIESDFSEELVVDTSSIDSDKDGITDIDEINIYGTNPNNPDTDGDGISDYEEIAANTDPLKKNTIPTINQNVEVVTNYAVFNHNWTTIDLPKSFTNPVVITGPATYNESQPGIVRIRNVGSDSFDIRFQEWNYLDGKHKTEMAAYLVMDEGRYVLDDGSIWEVGTFTLKGNGDWQYVPFSQEFPSPPMVFLTVQTAFDDNPIIVRARYVDSTGFEAAIFNEESNKTPHGTEIIGYIAIWNASGYGNIADTPYAVGTAVVNSSWSPVGGFNLLLQEEKSADSETYHIEEVVDVLVLGEQVFAQNVWWIDHDPASLRIR